MPPQVFISHASEDKERFVLDFATQLRERGVDAWVDKWEILPGDSLVDKIFEEGLKEADAVIIVLSRNSVDKSWVREELNASLVKRVEDSTKIIPVVIDNCEIPEALRSTVWTRVENLEDYSEELSEVQDAIFERRSKPPVGRPPQYTETFIEPIQDLTKSETLIFRLVAAKAVEAFPSSPSESEIRNHLGNQELSDSRVQEGFTVLKNRGYLTGIEMRDGSLRSPNLAHRGWKMHAQRRVENYNVQLERVATMLANHDLESSSGIGQKLELPHWFTAYALRELSKRGFIEIREMRSGDVQVIDKSTELERWIRLNN